MSKTPPRVSHDRDKFMWANSLQPLRDYSKVYKPLQERLSALQSLKTTLQKYESDILQALHQDLHKHPGESFLTELLQVYEELDYMIAHLPKFMRPKKVKTPLSHFGSISRIYAQSYGLVLIISPWNYPLNLSLIPLIGAIAGGNCVLLKPSEYSEHTSALLVRLITESLPPNLAQVVLGDSEVGQSLLQEPFDFIFFTGSVPVGRIVMQHAAHHLTPVVLELGGKNPCIITQSADIDNAAKKVAWGKFLNAGQTCIAPDYVLVQERVLEEFVQALISWIHKFFGDNPKQSEYFGRIISARHFARIESLLRQSTRGIDTTLSCESHLSHRIAESTRLDSISQGGDDRAAERSADSLRTSDTNLPQGKNLRKQLELPAQAGDKFITRSGAKEEFTSSEAIRQEQRSCDKIIKPHLALGGELDSQSLYVAPTIFVLPRDETHPLMQEEIFAPILPIMPFGELSECLLFSAKFPKPLASYIFTRNSKEKEYFLRHFSFGNGCVNDCVMQVANPSLPFGGIGNSGMGSYHGAQSFLTFTHQKSVLENRFEIPLRYPPFRQKLFGLDFQKLCKLATKIWL